MKSLDSNVETTNMYHAQIDMQIYVVYYYDFLISYMPQKSLKSQHFLTATIVNRPWLGAVGDEIVSQIVIFCRRPRVTPRVRGIG